ncbi:MAG: potassium channel family protein [Thermoanaerobaculia bacterium]
MTIPPSVLDALASRFRLGKYAVCKGEVLMPGQILELVLAPRPKVLEDFYGNLRAIALALVVLLVYVLSSSWLAVQFEDWTFLHSAYFTVINVTTVGFGDVTPVTHAGKILAAANALTGLILFGVVVALVTLAFQPAGMSGTATIESIDSGHEGEGPTPAGESTPRRGLAAKHFLRALGQLVGRDVQTADADIDVIGHDHGGGDMHIHIEIRVHSAGGA